MVANKRLVELKAAKKGGTDTTGYPVRRMFSARQFRWLVATFSGILVGANAGVQLWQNLDLGDRFFGVTQKPLDIEQVQQPRTNTAMSKF